VHHTTHLGDEGLWTTCGSPEVSVVHILFKTVFHLMWISDQDENMVFWATHTLFRIAHWLEGAQALVNAKVQDHIFKLLKSQGSWVATQTCQLMEVLAGHKPTVPAILELNPLKQLVVLAGWVIGSDRLSCRKLDVEPRVAGDAPGTRSMPFTQLVNGRKASQLLQTQKYLRSFSNWPRKRLRNIELKCYTQSSTILPSTRRDSLTLCPRELIHDRDIIYICNTSPHPNHLNLSVLGNTGIWTGGYVYARAENPAEQIWTKLLWCYYRSTFLL
jgi:hypothetical protein